MICYMNVVMELIGLDVNIPWRNIYIYIWGKNWMAL